MTRLKSDHSRSGNPAARSWQPLAPRDINPHFLAMNARLTGMSPDALCEVLEVWGSPLYECVVRLLDGPNRRGAMHLSIKRRDRAAVRDWRHLQAIKNEVAGPEREGLEIFPAESRLVDGANEYHLWVLPEGERIPFGYAVGAVHGPEDMDQLNAAMFTTAGGTAGKGRQREWEPGLPTGRGLRCD